MAATKKPAKVVETTKVAEATVATLNGLRTQLDALVKKYNESVEFAEFKKMKKLEEEMAEVTQKYASISEGECFVKLKKAPNIMLEAALTLTYPVIGVKDTEDKATGKVVKVIKDGQKKIDPLRLHKFCEGIGANPEWWALVERLNMLMTAATAVELGAIAVNGEKLTVKGVQQTHAMSQEARKLSLKETGVNEKIMLENLQTVLDAMLGAGYKVDKKALVYLRDTHTREGKSPMTVSCANSRSVRVQMLQVCNYAITGNPFVLDFKRAK